MDSLPKQHIDALPGATRNDVYKRIGLLCTIRARRNPYSEDEIARKVGFGSAKAMHYQLKMWGLEGLLPPEKEEQAPTKRSAQKENPHRPKKLGPDKGLPPLDNAARLFKERLEALIESVEQLQYVDETLRGRHFIYPNVETADVFTPRETYSNEEWEALCEQYELDPNDKGFWNTNASIKLPGRATLMPSEIESTLIGVYALAGGRMDLLVEALHHNKPAPGTDTWEHVRQCVEGSKSDGDSRDGLRVVAGHLATWVRGSVVGPGRPSGLSEADLSFAYRITHDRKQGLTDEEITRKESHRRKEDGTSYSVKDVTELGDLGLSWP